MQWRTYAKICFSEYNGSERDTFVWKLRRNFQESIPCLSARRIVSFRISFVDEVIPLARIPGNDITFVWKFLVGIGFLKPSKS